jgi:DNA primase
MDQVLDLVRRYLPGRQFRQAGNGNILTTCPFHKGGEEKTPSFSVNPNKGLYHCFACHEAGTLKGLLFALHVPRATIDAELVHIQPLLDSQREQWKLEKTFAFSKKDPFKADYTLPETLLSNYEFCPFSLTGRDNPWSKLEVPADVPIPTLPNWGFDPSVLQKLQVGYDQWNHRITWPLRDLYGDLAGISGGSTKPDQWPKYKVYQGGTRINGKWVPGDYGSWFDENFPDYRCENHDFLWNYNAVYPRVLGMSDPDATVVLVEGFKACTWMIQQGFVNTVALMGSYLSDRQRQMLERLRVTLYLFLDNDNAGRKATYRIGNLIKQSMNWRVRVVPYPPNHVNTQPDFYPHEWLTWMFANSRTLLEHLNDSRRM